MYRNVECSWRVLYTFILIFKSSNRSKFSFITSFILKKKEIAHCTHDLLRYFIPYRDQLTLEWIQIQSCRTLNLAQLVSPYGKVQGIQVGGRWWSFFPRDEISQIVQIPILSACSFVRRDTIFLKAIIIISIQTTSMYKQMILEFVLNIIFLINLKASIDEKQW